MPAPLRRRLIAALDALGEHFHAGVVRDVGESADVAGRQIHARASPVDDADLGGELGARLQKVAVGQIDATARLRATSFPARDCFGVKFGHGALLLFVRETALLLWLIRPLN
jgi:hypothetical protein